MVPPISTKFCMLVCIGRLNPPLFKKSNFKKPRWYTAIVLKIVKCDISATVILTDFDKSWYRNAYLPSQPDGWPSVWKLENPRLRNAAILKIEKTWSLVCLILTKFCMVAVALFVSFNGVPWRNSSKSTVGRAKMGHASLTMPPLAMI